MAEKNPPYRVQYSHNKIRWYGYGADATRPPTLYDTLGAAEEIFNLLVDSYMGLLKYVRIIDVESNTVKEGVAADR